MNTLLSSLTLAFVTGLISSFGHCLGMCGGIVAIYSARQAQITNDSNASLLTRITSFLPLHLGRITTYTFFGAVIGLAGSLLDQAGGMMGWQGLFSVLVGIAMLLVSLSLLGVLPPIEATLLTLTNGNSPMARMRGLFGKRSFLSTLTLGVLWGFLPCGLVFAMLVMAAGAQSMVGGALTMLVFGLGTVPTLVGFGIAANLIGPKLRGGLQSFAAVLLMLFAVQTVLRGLAVANIIPSFSFGQVMLW
ncbi:MAG: sulfite exporter TauE/SafE family protein [Anaerolineales bacterium]|nr:sulfite exporter TauE/SafE family protein [Anaerolineales bacterium]MBP6211040.1 sulfite exporter TauE/SafE family protein [Anaerolineales bacterium]